MPALLSIVSVTHNSADVVADMVRSTPADAELVVVDNASSDGGPQIVAELRPDAVVVEMPGNGGFSRGCNVGAAVARGDVVIFLNPDCRAQPGGLERLGEAARSDPGSIFGPGLLEAGGELRQNLRRRSVPHHEVLELLPSADRWVPRRWRRDLPAADDRYEHGGPVDYLQGACLAIARQTFLSLGGFDEDYFLYSEEESLCDAVRDSGGRCVYVPEVVVTHVGATSTQLVSRFALRHAYRSRAIFYRKRYGELGGLAAVIAIAVTAALSRGLRPLARAGGGHAGRVPRQEGEMLRGLLSGAVFRLGRL